jgi:uncharacterized protein (TIGR03437 family)
LRLSPEAVVGSSTVPPTSLNVNVLLTIDVLRGPTGNLGGGHADFKIFLSTGEPVEITGIYFREGAVNENGPIHIDWGFRPEIPFKITPPSEKSTGVLFNKWVLSEQMMPRIYANPSRFYIDLRTSASPNGALRGQLHKFTESLGNTVLASPVNEVPPITDVTAEGVATVTINPTRNSAGEIAGGQITLSVLYEMPARSEIIGLNIHKGPVRMIGEPVIRSGLSRGNSIITDAVKGSVSLTVPIKSNELETLKELIADPTNFYLNLQTTSHETGLIRGQLGSFIEPPIMQISDTAFLIPNSNAPKIVDLVCSGEFFVSPILNGQGTRTFSWTVSNDPTASRSVADIPADILAKGGKLAVQVGTGSCCPLVLERSAPSILVIPASGKLNSTPVITADAAKFGATVAPESMAAAFGDKLASQAVSASTIPLPTMLDGTTVYVNGVAAGLFYVSEKQINYIIPSSTRLGPAEVVVVAKDGVVSRGTINVTTTTPAIYTRTGDGAGAPAGVGSKDGQNFDLALSNSDGSPVPIDAGSFVTLFGTGLRFPSTPMKIMVGGVEIDPLYFGPQGSLDGFDQINLQLPLSLAGRGEVDLVFTLDGKTSNAVRLRIR